MAVVLPEIELSPPRQFPAAYGPIAYWLSPTPPDLHIWSDVNVSGGPSQYLQEQCALSAVTYDSKICDPELLPAPLPSTRGVLEFGPNWVAVSTTSSTHSCVDLEKLVTESLQDSVQLFGIENRIREYLETDVPAPAAAGCLSEALAEIVGTFGAVNGAHRGLVTLSPKTYTEIRLESPGYFNTTADGKLTDPLGNWYVLNAALPPNHIYGETEARYLIYMTDPEILSESSTLIRTSNQLTVRGLQGWFLARSNCAAFGRTYPSCVE